MTWKGFHGVGPKQLLSCPQHNENVRRVNRSRLEAKREMFPPATSAANKFHLNINVNCANELSSSGLNDFFYFYLSNPMCTKRDLLNCYIN